MPSPAIKSMRTHYHGFEPMAAIIPEGIQGDARIEHFTVGPPSIRMMIGNEPYIVPGTYARLVVKGEVVMSDVTEEQTTNYSVVAKARGDMLIAGLGFGMVLVPILKRGHVRSVTVIERNPNVRALVEEHLRKAVGPKAARKLFVLDGDIMTWEPVRSIRQFDVIYFDIWNGQSTDDLAVMTKLHRRYRKWLREGGWMESWRREHLRRQRKEGRWR